MKSIKLKDYEQGKKYKGDYREQIELLQARLEQIQVAHILNQRRAIIVFEGWDAAGKGGIISRLTGEWDHRYFKVWPISAPTKEELAHHHLWRFWQRLPAMHHIAVFDRSWYGRVLVERVEGFATHDEWQRAYDEINAFEAQQLAADTAIIKIFVHVTQEVQDQRLKDRLEEPWKRWKTGLEDYRNRAKRAEYLDAMHDMLNKTHVKHAPWVVIDGNDKRAARIAALTAIADHLEKYVSMEPPGLDPAIEAAAREAGVID